MRIQSESDVSACPVTVNVHRLVQMTRNHSTPPLLAPGGPVRDGPKIELARHVSPSTLIGKST
ncbi:MAG TPA: hypothetical protein VGR35_07060 [Tepidisphaeraceae bacterium]|nr:hypothetical protein [Tepidisphaeraceae bacterium]